MSIFKIQYFASDYEGYRDEIAREENFEGTYEEVVAHVEATETGWGFNYKVGGRRHGEAVVTEISTRVAELEELVAQAQGELTGLYSKHGVWKD